MTPLTGYDRPVGAWTPLVIQGKIRRNIERLTFLAKISMHIIFEIITINITVNKPFLNKSQVKVALLHIPRWGNEMFEAKQQEMINLLR